MRPNAQDVPRYVQRLNHGDWVILEAIQSCTVYAVRPANEQAGEPALLYLSALPPQGPVEPAACLEVVEQGEWLGLRSPLLEGLFLQARKKAPNLVFFSPRLGVWEQWKAEALYHGLLQQQSPAMCLTSRQVPAITVSVRAWRVGCAPSQAPPRHFSFTPIQQLDTVDGHATDQMIPVSASGVLECSASLQDEALELSHHVVKGYVLRVLKWPLYLTFRLWRAETRTARRERREAAEYNTRRFQSATWAVMQQRAAVERHARHMFMLACQCWTRHHVRRLVGALREWHVRARRSATLERLCAVCQRRGRRQRSAAALQAWGSYTGEQRILRRCCEGIRMQLAKRRARRVFQGWREMASAQRCVIFAFRQLLREGWMRRIIVRWHHLSRHLAAARHAAHATFATAAAVALRGVIGGWRALCVRTSLLTARAALVKAAVERRLLASVWYTWCDFIDECAKKRHRVGLVNLIRQQQLAGRVLRRWMAQVRVTAVIHSAAAQMAGRRERWVLAAAFAKWRGAARLGAVGLCENDRGAEVSVRLIGVLRRWLVSSRCSILARRVLWVWRNRAAAGLQLQVTAAAVARMRRRTRTAAALSRWRGYTRAKADLRRQLLAAHQVARLQNVLRAWVRAAADGRLLRIAVALVDRRLRFRRLYGLFHAWRGLAELRRGLFCSTVRKYSRSLAIRVLSSWRRRCIAVRAGIAVLERCRHIYEQQLMQAAWQALGVRVELRHSVQRCQRQHVASLARGVLRAWVRWAAHAARTTSFGRLLRCKWRRLVARGVLRTWFAASHSASLQTSLLEAMQAADGIGIAARRPTGRLHQALISQATLLPPPMHMRSAAVAVLTRTPMEGSPKAIQRILMVSLGGASMAGGRGGAAAAAAIIELLRLRLPVLARLSTQLRRSAQTVFNAWQLVTARRVRLQAATALLKARCKSRLLCACFRGWATAVADGSARRTAAMVMARRLVRGLAESCLAAWAQNANLSARLRRTCLKLLARRLARLARAVLLEWRAGMREQKERLQDKQRTKLDSRLALLQRAIDAWQLVVAEAAEVRELAEKRCASTWARFKRQVFHGWLHQMVLSFQHLATCSRLLQTRMERRMLAVVMAAWSTFVRVECQRREDWPMLCRIFYAWRTLVQPAGRAAAAAAAAAAELDEQRLRQVKGGITAAPVTSKATMATAPPAAPLSGQSETVAGPSPAVDVGGLSFTTIESSVRYGSDIEERSGQAGALSAQNVILQQWYRMLQGGGMAELPGGPMLLPFPQGMVAALNGGISEASTLRARLERLEEAICRGEKGDGEGVDSGAPQSQFTNANPPIVLPPGPQTFSSTRAMISTCRPEPGPKSQLRRYDAMATCRANTAVPRADDSSTLLPPTTIAQLASTVPPTAAAALTDAHALAPAIKESQQQLSLQPSRTSTTQALSASVPPEPGPLYHIRQGIGRPSSRALNVPEATNSRVSGAGDHVATHASAQAKPLQTGSGAVVQVAIDSSSSLVAHVPQPQKLQGYQAPQQGHQQQGQAQDQERLQHCPRSPAFSAPQIQATNNRLEPGPLFQTREGSSITVGRACSAPQKNLSALGSQPEGAEVAAKPHTNRIVTLQKDQGGPVHAATSHSTFPLLPPPPPPLPPPGLARSSCRTLTVGCVLERGSVAQARQSCGSSGLHGRGSSGAISAVEPSEWAATLPWATAAAAPAIGPLPPTLDIVLQPYSSLCPAQSSPQCTACPGGSPLDIGKYKVSTTDSAVYSEDTSSLASPGSLQAWSRRNTGDLARLSDTEPAASLLGAAAPLDVRDEDGAGGASGALRRGSDASVPALQDSNRLEVHNTHNAGGPAWCRASLEGSGLPFQHHTLPLRPVCSPSDRLKVLGSLSSGETNSVDAEQLRSQTLLKLDPGLHSNGCMGWQESPRHPSSRGRSDGMRMVDVVSDDCRAVMAEGHDVTGGLQAPPACLRDASLRMPCMPSTTSLPPPVAAATTVDTAARGSLTHNAFDEPTISPGQASVVTSAALPESSMTCRSSPQLELQQQSRTSLVSGGHGASDRVPAAAPTPEGTLAMSGLQSLPPPFTQAPHLQELPALLPGHPHPGVSAANGSWVGVQLDAPLAQPMPAAHPGYFLDSALSWSHVPVCSTHAAPNPIFASLAGPVPIGSYEHLSGLGSNSHHERPCRLSTGSTGTTATQQPLQAPLSSHSSGASGELVNVVWSQAGRAAAGLEGTVSTSTGAIPTAMPPGTDAPEMELLLDRLEARSKFAISSRHRSSLQFAVGGVRLTANAGGASAAALHSVQDETGGSTAVATSGHGAGLGLRLLDGIDLLLARASSLSAPAAPVIASRDGSDVVSAAECSHMSVKSSNHDDTVCIRPTHSDGGRPSPPEVKAVTKAPERVDLLDAALRRLEAARVHNRAATGIRPADREDSEAVDADQDKECYITGATRAAARFHALAQLDAMGRAGVANTFYTGVYPHPAAVAAASGLPAYTIDGGRVAPMGSGGGSTADIVATFLSGTKEVFCRTTGQHPRLDSQPSQAITCRATLQLLQQKQRQEVGLHCSGNDEHSLLSNGDSSEHTAPVGLRPAVPQSQAESSARSPGRAPVQLEPQAQCPPQQSHIAIGLATADTISGAETSVVDLCANCDSPTRTPQQPLHPRCGESSDSPANASSQSNHQQQHLEQSSDGSQRLHRADVARADGEVGGHDRRTAVEPMSLNRLPSATSLAEGHATQPRPLPLSLEHQVQSPSQPPQTLQSCVDPLEEVLKIAQRRGNVALAATLAGLVRDLPPVGTGGQPSAVEQKGHGSTPCGPPPLHQQQHYGSTWGSSVATDSRAPCMRPQSGCTQGWSHGSILDASASTASDSAVRHETQLQSSLPMHVHDLEDQTAATSGPSGVPQDSSLNYKPAVSSLHGRASGESLQHGHLRRSSQPKTATQLPLLTLMKIIDSRSTITSGGSSDHTSTSSGGTDTFCDAVPNGFDPDPLHSPLRCVLGECQLLQSSAAQLEAEGSAVVRDVVAELSPRSAVQAALQAVLARQQTGGIRVGAGVGRRLLTPVGCRG